jgi:fructose/tagatose bisphosphate aldolase
MDDLRSVLTRLEKEGAALGHFNVANLTLLKAVVAAAAEIRTLVWGAVQTVYSPKRILQPRGFEKGHPGVS